MSTEGDPRYCIDCDTQIGNGVRCGDCTIDCRECDATFKTKADRNNHEHDGHCAACGYYLGDRPSQAPSRVFHREENSHSYSHFTVAEGEQFRHPVTQNLMGGGFLCHNCTTDDLEIVN